MYQIQFSPRGGSFCLVLSLLSLTKTVQSECNILVYVRRGRTGVNYYCDYSGPSGLSVELKRLDFSGVAILF